MKGPFLLRLWVPFSRDPGKELFYQSEAKALAGYAIAVASGDPTWTVQLRQYDGPVLAERPGSPSPICARCREAFTPGAHTLTAKDGARFHTRCWRTR